MKKISLIIFVLACFNCFADDTIPPEQLYKLQEPQAKVEYKNGFYLGISPIGVAVGLSSTDVALKLGDVIFGYDITKYLAAQLEVDFDYFVNVDVIGDYNVFNYSGEILFSPFETRIKPYIWAGAGQYVYAVDSGLTTKYNTDFSLSGGAGSEINLTKHQAIDAKAGVRFYNDLQRTGGDIEGWTSLVVMVLYKFTF